MKNRVIVICGPTATGKSDLAVDIALNFKGEVISADSRQVYKGLNVGAGKITKKEMRGIPHYLLDIITPKKTFSASDFKIKGEKSIADILVRGKLPIICGGTGFYIDTLLERINLPEVPPNEDLRQEVSDNSKEKLLKMLEKIDPVRAKEIDPNNKVRLIRAIEIAKALGKVPPLDSKVSEKYDILWLGLNLSPEILREKIKIRLQKRLEGMIKEARLLHEKGLSWKRMNELGLEYRYLALNLQKKLSKEEIVEKLNIEIWHYAKRQMTWFKRNKEIKWFEPNENKKIFKGVESFLK